jgi:hypothetical protein
MANRAQNGYTFAPTPGKGPTMTAQRCHSIRPSREALEERPRVRGLRSTRRLSTSALLVSLLIACGVATLAGAAPASASGLPPVPSCFYKAGYCEGVLINPAVAPTKETDDKHGIFELNASPLQFTEPVLCGEFCIYNHLNWVVGAPILSGCQTNGSTCKVRVRGGWLPVVVDQNDTTIAVYLLYTPPNNEVVLSGSVFAHECVPHEEPCQLDVVPVKGKAIVAAGPKGKYETETGADGSYALPVRKGTYKVRTVGSRAVQPASHSVLAQHDVSKLDFDVCTEPHGYRGPKLGCRLVEIDGQAVDTAGRPYERANAYVAGDSAQADAHGRFVLYAETGKVSVAAASWAQSILRATGSATVHATAPINTVRVTLHPRISITQATATSVFVHIDGLVLTPGTLTFAIEHNPPIENPTCISQQSQQVTGPSSRIKSTVFEAPSGLLSQSFCKGNYNASVLSGGTTLATEPFAIP